MPNKPEITNFEDERPILPDSPAEWELESDAFHFANDPNLPDDVRAYIRELWGQFVLREDAMVEPIMRREIDAGACIYCGYALGHFMLSGPSRFHMDTFEASVECGRCRSQGPNVNGQETLEIAEEIAVKAWTKPTDALNSIFERRATNRLRNVSPKAGQNLQPLSLTEKYPQKP